MLTTLSPFAMCRIIGLAVDMSWYSSLRQRHRRLRTMRRKRWCRAMTAATRQTAAYDPITMSSTRSNDRALLGQAFFLGSDHHDAVSV